MGKISRNIGKVKKILNFDFNKVASDLDELKEKQKDDDLQREKIKTQLSNNQSDIISIIDNNKNNYNKLLQDQQNEIELLKKQNDSIIELLKNQIEEQKRINDIINLMNNDLSYINYYSKEIYKQFDYVNLESLLLNNNTNINKKKVLICGFYGAQNAGDELMLETMLNRIKINTKNLDITIMLCDEKNIDITKYGKYSFIHYPRNNIDFNIIANYFDVLLFAGGALIDDTDYSNNKEEFSLGYILINLTMRFIAFNKKTILYGLSTNKKLSDREFLQKLQFIISNSSHFSLRDTNSLMTLEEVGIDTKKIIIVDDIVFANDFIVNKNNKKNDCIGVILICNRENEKDNEKVIKTLRNYIKNGNKDIKINLITFYNYNNNDYNEYTRLIKKMKIDDINIIDEKYTFESISTVINNQDVLISARYHGALLAMAYDKPNICIVDNNYRHYYNKMTYLCNNYNFNTILIKDYDIKEKDLDIIYKKKRSINSYIANISKKAKNDIDGVINEYIK